MTVIGHCWLLSSVLGLGLILGISFFGPSSVMAFDDDVTHRSMTARSVDASILEEVLTEDLSLTRGLISPLQGAAGLILPARQWLQEGAVREDDPTCRASNHFHNPLKPFTSAGVTDLPTVLRAICSAQGFAGRHSSVRWGTRHVAPTQRDHDIGNPFDWDAARNSYLKALTLASPAEREASLADTLKALGHVVHLIQDAAVPAHVRNDFTSHLDFCRPSFNHPCENGFERFVRLNDQLVRDLPSSVPLPARRLTAFWDTDRYNGSNPTNDLVQGIAEYTNANFFSLSTIFTESSHTNEEHAFPFPAVTSTNLEAWRGQTPVALHQRLAEDRIVDLGQYLRKERDGEVVDPFVRIGYFTRDFIDHAPPTAPLRLTFMLDEAVQEEYARHLVPRALRYGTELMNYFFRGRLDVDLVEDPQSAASVRVQGRNASAEALDGGSLMLFADVAPEGSPAGSSRVRVEARPLQGPQTVAAEPNAELQAGPFELPEGAERFVVVYKGKLGDEVPDPTSDVLGAVIGKVLGGVRVEEIFKGNDRWQVRTPVGLFTLPLFAEDYEQVKWGDQPDMIVAHTPLLGGASGRIETYDLSREADGLGLVVSGATGLVELALRDTITLPFHDPPVITTLNFTQLISYRQQIGHYIVDNTFTWTPHAPFGPTDGVYNLTSRTVRPFTFRTLHEVALPFSATIPVRLDPAHVLNFGSTEEPYAWQLTDVAADASGRVLGVVAVFPTRPGGGAQVPVFQLDEDGATKDAGETVTIRPFFHLALAAIWAIVDLKNGTVVASTADAVVTVNHQAKREAPPWDNAGATFFRTLYPGFYRENVNTFNGGPDPGTRTVVEPAAYSPRSSADGVFDRIEGSEGDLGVSAQGWMRSYLATELRGAGLLNFETGEVQRVTAAFTYDCPIVTCNSEAERVAFTATTSRFDFTEPPAMLFTALRARPAPGGERLVLLGSADRGGPGDTGHVVVWDPQLNHASVRFSVGPTLHAIAHATGRTVMLWQRPVFGTTPQSGTYLLSLDGDRAPVFFADTDLRLGFRLLDPRYLYRTSDLRFYRLEAPLQPTVLPAKLLDVPNKPIGDFHIVAVP